MRVVWADRRLQPSVRRAPVAEIERMLGLYRELYRGFTKLGSLGSVRGALSNQRPYRDVRQAWRVVRERRLIGVVADW